MNIYLFRHKKKDIAIPLNADSVDEAREYLGIACLQNQGLYRLVEVEHPVWKLRRKPNLLQGVCSNDFIPSEFQLICDGTNAEWN